MTLPSNLASETLPPHLQALLDLTREAEGPTMMRWLRDHRVVVGLSLCYGFIAFLGLRGGDAAPILFFGGLAVVFSLDAVNERRARERLKLLLEVLRHRS